MVIDHNIQLELYLNGQKIEQVMQYKYLGNIIKSVNNSNVDIFSSTYSYLCDQERKAIFGMMHKIRDITPLPPKVMFKLECGTWYHHPRRLQCVLSRNLRILKVATWHYRCRHNLKNNCIWDNLQCCLLVQRSPSKPAILTFDLQSRKV